MTIEFKIRSVVLRNEDIKEKYPNLIPMINSYLHSQKLPKKRKPRKKKKTVAVLIDKILADIQAE